MQNDPLDIQRRSSLRAAPGAGDSRATLDQRFRPELIRKPGVRASRTEFGPPYHGTVASDRKRRTFIRQWHKRYPFPSAWVSNKANKQCRRSEAQWLAQFDGASLLKRRQIEALIDWRFAHQPKKKEQALAGIAGASGSGHARRCIKKALATSGSTEALDCLLAECDGIPGWGPEMASALLAALITLQALKMFSPRRTDEFVRADWPSYLRHCRRIARAYDIPLAHVGQALWAAADRAPELPTAK
jgi:hypothetical protein